MAWGIGDIFKAIKGSGKGFEGSGGGSGVKTAPQSIKDSDYGRQLRGEKSPAYSDALEGIFNRGTPNEVVGSGIPGGERGFASRLDPSDSAHVLKLQRQLNKMGYTDEEGNALAEDAMFGPKTLGALRSFQHGAGKSGIPFAPGAWEEGDEAVPEGEPSWTERIGGAASGWKDWLFGDTASDKSASARDSLFEETDSGEWQRKQGPGY